MKKPKIKSFIDYIFYPLKWLQENYPPGSGSENIFGELLDADSGNWNSTFNKISYISIILILLSLPLWIKTPGESSVTKKKDMANMCVDETLINLDYACTVEAQPVCGCDSKTYNNSCEAFNWYGVIAYEDGVCD